MYTIVITVAMFIYHFTVDTANIVMQSEIILLLTTNVPNNLVLTFM
jgi:hypothetical protein